MEQALVVHYSRDFQMLTLTGRQYAVTNYLDDFLFTEITPTACDNMVRKFLQICQTINLPVAHDKTEWSTLQITFLGILLDGQQLKLCIPIDKRDRAIDMLRLIIDKKKTTVKNLQQLTGFLNFLTRAIHPGQAFTRRMYAKYAAIQENPALHPYHHIKLDREFKFDCRVWLTFLESRDNSTIFRPMIDINAEDSAHILDFFTDSSAAKNLGFGGTFGKHWIFGAWPPGFIATYKPSIAYLELFAVVAAILAWQDELRNLRMILFCDNQSVVQMINQTTSKCHNCMFLIRLLVLSGLKSNRRVYAKFVPTKSNTRADALSRLKIDKFLKLSQPDIDHEPTKIPSEIWPTEKIWQMKA